MSVDFLSDDEPVQLCFQVNNLNDLQSLQGNYTKSFKLPLTARNRQILGFPDDITITTNAPYQFLKAKLVIDGIEIIPNGALQINYVQNNTAEVAIFSGNCNFLDSLPGQLADMGDSTSVCSQYGAKLVWNKYSLPFPNDPTNIANCVFDVQHAAWSQQKTSGWIFPIVDYGSIDKVDFTKPINVRNQRPGFFLHTAIELLVESTNYTIDYENSSLTKDPLYNKLIVQFANSTFSHGTDYQNIPDFVDGFTTTLGQQLVITPKQFYNGLVNFNHNGLYNGSYYTAGVNINGKVTINFDGTLIGRKNGSHGFLGIGATPPSAAHIYISTAVGGVQTDLTQVQLTLDDAATSIGGSFFREDFINQTATIDVELVPGMQIFIRYDIDQSHDTTFIMRAGAILNFVVDQVSVLWKQNIQCERIFPDISQLNLLKDTLQHFGQLLITDSNSGTIRFISFKDIVSNIPKAKDWSLKCVDIGKQINFQIGNYSQINWMRCPEDSTIPVGYMPLYFADDHIDISNDTLIPNQPVSNLFTSIFGPSLNRGYYGGSIAQICPPANTYPFAVGNTARLLVDQKLNISQMGAGSQPLTVTFTDNDPGHVTESVPINDIISVPYFYKVGGECNLCWCDKGGQKGLKSTYYGEFQNILNQVKQVTRYFMLTPADIIDLDFSIPIYLRQDGAYFYITLIDSWVKGNPTKVTLIRL